MKRAFYTVIVVVCALSLILSGCRASMGEPIPSEPETEPTEAHSETAGIETETGATVPKEGLDAFQRESDVVIGATGRLRLTYTGNVSSVRYITSVSELPEYPELEAYDEAYFQDRALVLVMETVTNGTVEVGISGIILNENTAAVQLSHETKGDVGTTVMTTWLLWAEVEAGLDYAWTVDNPAVEPSGERY